MLVVVHVILQEKVAGMVRNAYVGGVRVGSCACYFAGESCRHGSQCFCGGGACW